jgi:hypothetical protein
MQSPPSSSSNGLVAAGIDSAHSQNDAPDFVTSPGPAIAGACANITPTQTPKDATTLLIVLFMSFLP